LKRRSKQTVAVTCSSR